MTDYGSDISVFPDLDSNFSLVTGVHVVAEALARRFSTPRGGLSYDTTYGYDLRSLLNKVISGRELVAIGAEIEGEALKDERVQDASATVTYNAPANNVKVKLIVTTAAGPFALTLLVSSLTVTLLKVG